MTAFRSLVVAALLSTALLAQCDPQWQPGDPVAAAIGAVNTVLTWDPDGAGPLGPQLLVGGLFKAGLMVPTPIATYDGSQWSAVGTPPAGTVTAMAPWNGGLAAAFQLNSSSTNIATWNGSTWQTIGTVLSPASNDIVKAITSYNGELVVGGTFNSVAGVAANNLARWNGTMWSTLGAGVVGDVHATAVFQNLLYVGGAITQAGGIAVANLTAWNGSSFAYTASFNGAIDSLATYSSLQINGSRLFAGGAFTSVSAVVAQHIATFTPATNTWSALGAGLTGTTCTALLVTGTGLSYHVTAAVGGPTVTQNVWTLQSGSWVALGTVAEVYAPLTVTSLVLFGGEYLLGLGYARRAVRRYDAAASTWPAVLGKGIDGTVSAVCAVGNDIVISGPFQSISGVTMNGIARRGSSSIWQPLGSGVGAGGGVFALTTAANGDVIAAGSFATMGGVAAHNIARWNGAAWAAFGSGVGTNGPIQAVCTLPDGDVIAAGSFGTADGVVVDNIARWDGAAWHAFGTGTSGPVRALAMMPNGDVVAGGAFLGAGGVAASYLARWNGSNWSPLGGGVDNWVTALAVLSNGQLAVGGIFSTAGGATTGPVAIWNGSSWSSTVAPWGPSGDIFAIQGLPDGDVVAGGAPWPWSPSGLDYTCLARCRHDSGPSWGPPAIIGSGVFAMTTLASGDLIVVGDFQDVGGLASGNVARYAASCHADATAYGTGCAGSGGANVLTATQLPWTGSEYRGLATGMPAIGFAIVVTGFTQISVPIASVLPQGLPGCSLLVAPDFLDVVVPSAGRVATQVVLPDTVTLAGLVFDQQVVPFALGVGGSVAAITSTNALQLTIGTF